MAEWIAPRDTGLAELATLGGGRLSLPGNDGNSTTRGKPRSGAEC
jgi:hypothetical protein